MLRLTSFAFIVWSTLASAQGLDLKKLQTQPHTKPIAIKLYRPVEPQDATAAFFQNRKFEPTPKEFANQLEFLKSNTRTGGARIVLGKGIWVVARATDQDAQFRVCEGLGTIIEGQGAETIIVSEQFFNEKKLDSPVELIVKQGCTFRNLTFVNARFQASAGYGDQYWNVHFAGKTRKTKDYLPDKPIALFSCAGCIFDDIKIEGLEKTHSFHLGSVVWDAKKKSYVPYERRDYGPFLNALQSEFEKKHATGKLVDADKAIAKTALVSLIAAPRKQNGMLIHDEVAKALGNEPDSFDPTLFRNGLGVSIAQHYGLQNLYAIPTITPEELKKKVAEEVKAKRPLSSLVYIGRARNVSDFPSDALEEAINVVRPALQTLASKYKPCRVSLNAADDSGGNLYKIVSEDIKSGSLPFKYPFLSVGSSSNCTISVTLTQDKLNSWVEERDRKVGFHNEIDWDAAYKAEAARSAARTAAISNLSASMSASFASMENTWKTFQNSRVHFEHHVGGTDLVSYKVKMNDNAQQAQSRLASERDAINASAGGAGQPFEKSVAHDVVTWHRVGDADVAGKVEFIKGGKVTETFQLTPLKGKWEMDSCTVKYRKDGSELKLDASEEWNTCKADLEKGEYPMYAYDYAELNIYPYIDRYLDKNILRSTASEFQAMKSGQGANKIEAILFYRWLGVGLSQAQKFAILDQFSNVGAEREFVQGAVEVGN